MNSKQTHIFSKLFLFNKKTHSIMLYMSFVLEEFTFLNFNESLPADSKAGYFSNQFKKI